MQKPGVIIGVVAVALCLLAGCVTESRGGREFKESPEDAAAYNLQLGAEYLRSGKLQLARERLESSIDQNGKVAEAHYLLAIVYQRVNEERLADAAFRNAIRIAPNDGDVQNSYAVYLCGQDKFRQAEDYFRKAARNPLYSTPATALVNAGVCMRSKPDMSAAEQYFRSALEVRQNYPDALLQLAVMKYEQDNALGARAFVERLLSSSKPSPDALLLAWRIEQKLGDERAAADYADELQSRYPDSRQARAVRERG